MSTMLGAPPNTWKKSEQAQLKAIHAAFKTALVDHDPDDLEEGSVDLLSLAQSDSFMSMLGNDFGRTATVISRGTSNNATGSGNGNANGSGEGANNAGELDAENNGGDGSSAPQNGNSGKKDAEYFLPGDSPLRSKNGEMKEPSQVPFKDFNQFLATLDFEFWKDNFRNQNQDRYLSEVAQSTVAHICNAQSRGELRVRHGSVPLGKILRKKREQITPLALCLHEFKMWAAHKLRVMSIFEKSSFKEIERRIRYLEMLQRKEVWGGSSMPLQSGMRPIAHDKLFRLFLNAREDLVRARDYAYRGYCRRASREKLGRLGNLLKDVLLNEMRVVSGLMSMTEKLEKPKTRSLQPTDLLNSWKNQTFVNYENLANVCLRALCEVPLVRGSLLSSYEEDDVKAAIMDIKNWSHHNLFCLPPQHEAGPNAEPTYLLDDEKQAKGLLPEVYASTAVRIKDKLAEHDPHAKPPLTRKMHLKILRKAFKNDVIILELMKRFLKYMASLQDMVPAIYISFQLWELAGQGGDFVLFDMLREQCIGVMQSTIARVHTCQLAQKELVHFYGKVVLSWEEAAESRRLRKKKAEYQPPWVANYYHLKQDLLIVSRKSYTQAYLQLWEVAKDAWEYDLTADQLNEKIENMRQVCEDYAPNVQKQNYQGQFQTASLVDETPSGNWLKLEEKPKQRTSKQRMSKRTVMVGDKEEQIAKIFEETPDDDDDNDNQEEIIYSDDDNDLQTVAAT